MHTAIFLVSNIHCPSCVSYAQDVLHEVAGISSPVDVSLIQQTIRVRYDDSVITSRSVVNVLTDAAFEVQHVTVVDHQNFPLESYDLDVFPNANRILGWGRVKRKHIENCTACQKEEAWKSNNSRTWASMTQPEDIVLPSSPGRRTDSTGDTLVDHHSVIGIDGSSDLRPSQEQQYIASISVGGMTCASCTRAITESLESLDMVLSANVNLVGNCATVTYRGPKANSDKVIEAIEDLGYEATIDRVRNQTETKPGRFKAALSIKGMTCGSCVGKLTRAIESLPFVTSGSVDLLGASAAVEFSNRENLDQVLDCINNLGYEATLVTLKQSTSSQPKPVERTVQLQIDGMYCSQCPERVGDALKRLVSSEPDSQTFQISEMPTLKNPRITITYDPSCGNKITVRSFISTISAVDSNFRIFVYHPPSLEELSHKLQHKERWHILRRLIFSAIVAVPTLIIGVVFMMAVPASNPTGKWFDQPIWAGSVMRSEWALLIMTTPVMFYGADIFHRRACKEIWSMWKPGSKVPLRRRFYRFGSMNLLISAATMVAYLSSLAVLIINARTMPMNETEHRSSKTYFDTVTFLTFFILIGRFLEAYSKAKTGDAVSALSKLRPKDAILVENELKRIPIDQLEVGDIVQVPHGHSPPTDGLLEEHGNFLFDESSLTGESMPVTKSNGDMVFTGTVNVSDPVKIKVTGIGGSSVLDNIIQVVREGQAKRAPIERFADTLTGYFVPVITLLAITTWVVWLGLAESGQLPLAWRDSQQGGWPFWSLEFAIAVFVVACPCGIGLAAPTALFVGGGLAAKRGILVQGGGEAFQEASGIDTIVFDKTGTLTQGQMKVADFEVISKDFEDDLILAMTKAMEEVSTHPIAKAIAEHCSNSLLGFNHAQVQEVPGLGMKGKFTIKEGSKTEVFEAAIGNQKLLASLDGHPQVDQPFAPSEKGQSIRFTASEKPSEDQNFYLTQLLQKHQSLGRSTAILAIRRIQDQDSEKWSPFQPTAIFSIADPVRSEALEVLRSIRERGVETHMCTGDNQTTAHAIASQLDIPVANIRAGALPRDKAAYINELQNQSTGNMKRRIVAFVGDGTNDSPALSAADVSIALSSGSDVAMTTASFILLNSDLGTILTLITLSKRVFRRVMLNFAWAAVYNLCLVPVAAGVFFRIGANEMHGGFRLNPVWASVAMALSSVSVVGSSLALKLPEVTMKGLAERLSGLFRRRG